MKIFGMQYRVRVHERKIPGGDSNTVGRTDFFAKKIDIRKMPAKSELQQTYLHEVVHVINREMGLPQLSEKNIDRLALGLASFFRENGIKIPIA